MKTRRKSDKIEAMNPVNHPNSDCLPTFFEKLKQYAKTFACSGLSHMQFTEFPELC
jgi:hypothetical protein